ncbi:MAG: YceI family protein [Actinomycetota bacterium]
MSTVTKTIETDLALPDTGTWKLDLGHSSVSVIARHLMVSKVRGLFRDFEGTITVDEVPANSKVDVSIKAASIDTGIEQRDQHLRSADFLDVENYPAITFRGAGVEQTSGSTFKLHGDLTIRGVTQPVVLDVEYNGVQDDPWGGKRAGFSATTEINRDDWGVSWNQVIETGGVVVGKKLKVELEIEAVRQ